MPLKHLCTAKYAEIEHLRTLDAAGTLPAPRTAPRPGFSTALHAGKQHGLPAVIAEYKRASPSRGIINESVSPEDAAAQYRDAGAACISVLTEEEHFHGKLDFVRRMADLPRVPPLLRKDFLFHPLQVRATAATAASALLLMVRLTPDAGHLRHLRELAEAHGLEAVVEIFDEHELHLARQAGAHLIQVNARDLATLRVNRAASLLLAQQHRPRCPYGGDELWIAASGVESPRHLHEAAEAGYDAVLVGTSLMQGGAPGAALRQLLETRP